MRFRAFAAFAFGLTALVPAQQPAPASQPPSAAVPGTAGPADGHHYTNSSGQRVHSPVSAPSAPAGATAKCLDSSYSFSQHRKGTCSHHGGVALWLVH